MGQGISVLEGFDEAVHRVFLLLNGCYEFELRAARL